MDQGLQRRFPDPLPQRASPLRSRLLRRLLPRKPLLHGGQQRKREEEAAKRSRGEVEAEAGGGKEKRKKRKWRRRERLRGEERRRVCVLGFGKETNEEGWCPNKKKILYIVGLVWFGLPEPKNFKPRPTALHRFLSPAQNRTDPGPTQTHKQASGQSVWAGLGFFGQP